MRSASSRRANSPRSLLGGSRPQRAPETVHRAAGESSQQHFSLTDVDNWVKDPRSLTAQHELKVKMDMQQRSCEKILCDELAILKKILLQYQASSMNHDSDMVENFVETRAQQAVDEELNRIISDLVQVKGMHPHHRITAYSQLFAALNADLRMLVFTGERQKIIDLQEKARIQQETFRIDTSKFNYTLATKQKEVDALNAENAELREKCNAAIAEAQHWKRELGKTNRGQEQAQQDMVELRMQGIDFKSEVNRRSLKVLHAIQSCMGFVPSGVQKQILLLNMLKAPGDPLYDDVRRAKVTDRDKFLSSTFHLPNSGLGSNLGVGLGAESPPMSFIDMIGKKLVEGGVNAGEIRSTSPTTTSFPRSVSLNSTTSEETSNADHSRRRSSTSSCTTDTRRTSLTLSTTTVDDPVLTIGDNNVVDLAQTKRTISASPEQELLHNSFGELEDDDDDDDNNDDDLQEEEEEEEHKGQSSHFLYQDDAVISSDTISELTHQKQLEKQATLASRANASAHANSSVSKNNAAVVISRQPALSVTSPSRARPTANLLVKSAVPKQKKSIGRKKKSNQQRQQQFLLAKSKDCFVTAAGSSIGSSDSLRLPLPPRSRKMTTSPPLASSGHSITPRAGSVASPYRANSRSP